MFVRAGSYLCGALILLAAVAALSARPADAQSLIEMYRSARFRIQAQQLLNRSGHALEPRPVEPLPYVTDSVRHQMALLFPPPEPEPQPAEVPPIRIHRWTLTPKLASSWFEEKFADTRWAYLGSNELVAYDTAYTRELRARLEAHFGSPTRTIAEQPDIEDPSAEFIQFQYWFVLNDSIPMIVMDVNGPFERGVVVATDQEYRDLLPDLKEALLGPMMESAERAPYVEYYYLKDQNMWFRTGYDGERYFLDRIARPNPEMGRPFIETVRER